MYPCSPKAPRTAAIACLSLVAAVFAATPAPSAAQPPASAYVKTVEAWRTQRDAELRADDGWLTLVGLHWLMEGPNEMGSDPACAVPLPNGTAPFHLGLLTLAKGIVTFEPAPDTAALINGKLAVRQIMRPQPGAYDVLMNGSLTLFVIKRGDRYGVRVRNRDNPARRTFAGTHWFPVNDTWRVTARFVPHATPTSIMIANVLGAVEPWPSPGVAVFTLDGKEYRLHAVLDGADAHELFFIFRDLTTGHDTYGGGRFLYAEMPKDGTVVLDFIKADSPPCAFTPFATCPLPPKENALPVRIEAGELDPHK